MSKDLEMNFVKFLGKGASGTVVLVSHKSNDGSTIYNAIKISDSQSYDSLNKEFKILTKLKDCPRIIQLFGNNNKTLLEDKDYNGKKVFKMSMEYASGGTLTSYIKSNRGKLSDSTIKHFTRMILQGLVSIHNHGYVHCDLKPDNLLLFPRYDEETCNCSYELKISDFGLSTKTGERSDVWGVDAPFVGSPIYMSPESVKTGFVDKTLDLWSLGCVVLEMYNGKHPWLGVSTNDLKALLLCDGNNIPKIPKNVPSDARKFLETCFARKPKDRGSASKLLFDPFLIGVDDSGGEKRRLGSRVRKPVEKFEDIVLTKKPSKLKVVSTKAPKFKKVKLQKAPKFKKVQKKTLKVKIVPVQ